MVSAADGDGSASSTEVRADTADLGHFVEKGERYVQHLEQILDDLRRYRSVASSTLGFASPPDRSSRSFEELIAEATLNNAFVGQIRTSLLELKADEMITAGLTARFDRDLRSHGLGFDGTDLSLAQDRRRVREFRKRELMSAGITPEAGAWLIENSDAHRAAVALLRAGAHPDLVSEAGLDALIDIRGRLEPSNGSNTTDLTAEHLDALLARSYDDRLHQQVMAGTLPPPDDAIRDGVVAAMVAGLSPSDLDIDPSYFPTDYLRSVELRQEVADAEVRREAADGSSWSWWDSDQELLDAVDAELAVLRRESEKLARDHGIQSNGTVHHFSAVALASVTTGGSRWEGELYAFHFEGLHDSKISNGGIFGGGRGAIKDPGGSDVELRHIGARISADPRAAAAFYDGIGVGRTSNLATFLVGNELDRDDVANFAQGLAGASKATTSNGSSLLGFSGEELFRHPKPATQDQVIWYSPATLFVDGEFDLLFIADATKAVLRMADEGNEQAIFSHMGRADASRGMVAEYNGGEDPRNILMARTAEDPAAVTSLVRLLTGPRGRGWTGTPNGGTLDPLLKPKVAFNPTIGPDHEPYWLDELLSDRITDPNHPVVHEAGYPALSSPYPITSLLETAGADPGISRWILRYTADAVASAGPMVKDPGTAAGLDLIMAQHATLMFEPEALAAVDLERTVLNESAKAPVAALDWRTVYGEVLRFGRGQAVAAASDDLLNQAIAGAIDEDGWFEANLTRPFAHMAGRTETQAYQALIAYSAALDDEARAKNRRVNLAASGATSLIGTLPGLGPVASGTSAGWGWFFDGYPTNAELEAYKAAWDSEWGEHKVVDWERMLEVGYLEALLSAAGDAAQLEFFDPASGRQKGRLQKQSSPPHAPIYRLEHPDGSWVAIPPPKRGEVRASL